MQDIHGDPQRVRAMLGEYLDKTEPGALDKLVPILREEMPKSPEIKRENYQAARQFHLDSGLVEQAPEYDAVLIS